MFWCCTNSLRLIRNNFGSDGSKRFGLWTRSWLVLSPRGKNSTLSCSVRSLSLLSYLTLSAYRKVLSVFSQQKEEGEMLPIIRLRQLPTKLSFSTIVNLLPLNGVWCLPRSIARMHSLSASKLLLISAPSILVCFDSSPWSLALSDPARSMKLIFEWVEDLALIDISRIAWDREESVIFTLFCADLRLFSPKPTISNKFYTPMQP